MSNDSKSGEKQGAIAENTKTYFLKNKRVKMMFKDGAKCSLAKNKSMAYHIDNSKDWRWIMI